ncbi:MAG: DUF962 domain-containing protein [Thermodesulfobacteriota bacterium]|jgi:hypothetical protein|nr:DUF962 domain-containing protein [Candidatus Dadabacteria bacterium]
MGEGEKKFKSFSEFYPYYLSEHGDPVNRRLHFFGSLLTIIVVLFVIFTQTWIALILVPILGYGFAWIGHYFVEKNKPATFTYPLYSLMGDWVMFKDILTGKIKL